MKSFKLKSVPYGLELTFWHDADDKAGKTSPLYVGTEGKPGYFVQCAKPGFTGVPLVVTERDALRKAFQWMTDFFKDMPHESR